MRILFWSGLFWPHIGGVEVLAGQFVPALRDRGHEVIVVTSLSSTKLSRYEDFRGVELFRFPFHEGPAQANLESLRQVRREVLDLKTRFKPDLIHLNSVDASLWYHLTTDRDCHVPTVFTVHALPPTGAPKNSLARCALESARWVTTASAAMLQMVRDLSPAVTPRSSVIHYGLRTPDLAPSPLQFEAPVILVVGRVVPEKGFDLALEAFASVRTLFPRARLVLAGDGPARAALERKALCSGLGASVTFTGWVPPESVPDLINQSDLVVMPSRWQEPFGLVALQAAQMGRPVVAANVGGLPEIVEDHKTGLLFPKDNSSALAEKLAFLIENPEAAIRMGQAAFRKADRFEFDSFVDSYVDLFRRVVPSRSTSLAR